MTTDSAIAAEVELTTPTTPSAEHLQEVLYLRDWYIEEFEAVAADTDQHETLMRRHFSGWAGQITTGMLGTGAGEAQWAAFRDHLSNPDRYPGGRAGLLADAIHAEAIARLTPRAGKAVSMARQALMILEREDGSLQRREVCPFCLRKREGLEEHHTGRANLDTRKLCDACVELAQSEYLEWRRTPVAVKDSW